ncbi:MAG: hypothetical protein L6422_06000, partial [Candidatus Marinimicrobia bacterium]|nr:hypothetical protein [Candidatus Neomarinimicrobiota bacterium]
RTSMSWFSDCLFWEFINFYRLILIPEQMLQRSSSISNFQFLLDMASPGQSQELNRQKSRNLQFLLILK